MAISLIIFFVLLYFILVQWYPDPLFSTDGGWRVIRIIVGVDLVLGPLLTLIVFKAGKPGLKFDLMLIALAQFLALSWGVWNTYTQRPAAVIYAMDSLTPVPAYQLAEQGINAEKLKQFGDDWPILIYADIPQEEASQALVKSIAEKKPIYLFTEYYSKFKPEYAAVLKNNSMELESYVEDKPELKKIYQRSLLSNPLKSNISYLALHGREKWVTAVFDLDEMRIIDILEIEPSTYFYTKKSTNKIAQ